MMIKAPAYLNHPTCPHRKEVLRTDAKGDVFRCSHIANATGEARSESCGCGGGQWACETCPAYDANAKRFRYDLAKIERPDPLDGLSPRYVSTRQLVATTLAMMRHFPPDISAVAGVPRSGTTPANIIACQLNVPTAELSKDGTLRFSANGHRPMRARSGHLLVVDDTVYLGTQMGALRQRFHAGAMFAARPLFAAVYVTPETMRIPDYYGDVLPSPHLLEWNLFSSDALLRGRAIDKSLAGGFGLDLDGLLCPNPSAADTASPEAFEKWARRAPPTHIRGANMPLIVTARLSRYRDITQAWLNKWGMACDRLIMHPAASERERDGEFGGAAPWKAEQLRAHGVRWYVESNTAPAVALSRSWDGFVVDVESERVFRYGKTMG